jgi:hypothetical protein
MRALVVGASLLLATLGAAAPAAHAQVVVPPPIVVPPVGYSPLPTYGYFSTPLGIAGTIPAYGTDGLPSSSVCTDPQTGQQLVIPTANVSDQIARQCVRAGPGQ